MEGLVVILVLGIIVVVFVFPIFAFIRARSARDLAEQLQGRIGSLEEDVRSLRRQLRERQAGVASDQPHVEAPEPTSATSPAEPPPRVPAVDLRPLATPAHLLAKIKSETTTPPVAADEPVTPPLRGGSPATPTPAAGSPPSIPRTSLPPAPRPAFNWEQFMGAKMFAWVGGLALFLGIAYFIKYSFEQNLIPPALRVALGFLAGLGLLTGGVVLKRKAYEVTAQTLCATGVVVLYAVTFACRSVYKFAFFGPIPTFLLMVLITTTAFLLAARMNAMVVAILGMLGGFLTPILLSTGQDNPLGLFGYVALLDVGLLAVSLNRRWYFLALLGVIGTVVMQIGWAAKFFVVAKVLVALTVFSAFTLLFVAVVYVARRRGQMNPWFTGAAACQCFATLGFAFYLITTRELAARPGVLFSFVLAADLGLLALVLLGEGLGALHLISGAGAGLLLVMWTTGALTPELLYWALGLYFAFALLHSVFPMVLQRLRPGEAPVWWGHLFPPVALVLVLIPILRLPEVSMMVWPFVALIDLLAIALAVVSASALGILAVLVITIIVTGCWLMRSSVVLIDQGLALGVIGGFALLFFVAGVFGGRRILARLGVAAKSADVPGDQPWFASPDLVAQIPACSAALPFLLLILLVLQLPLANPSAVFGLAALMVVLMLALARSASMRWLPVVALGCVFALECVWYERRFTVAAAPVSLGWHLAFYAIFAAFPFLFRASFSREIVPWATAALAGPLHFFLVHRVMVDAYPNPVMGLVPAAFALPPLLSLVVILKSSAPDAPGRNSQLAWFGGAALFFVTLIFPVQFDRQWLTVGWALEGAALLWLFHRVPHPGLPRVGFALLVIAFARLALNRAVFDYDARAQALLFNWYLYTYGLVTAALFTGAKLAAPPRDRIEGLSLPVVLNTLGTILAFLLVNLEIADYFSPRGSRLVLEFSGNFARDMTYTIAWALFALILLSVGIRQRLVGARYASIGLLGVTLLKLFFHDLANLGPLYRIGALIGVALIAIVASVLYQRFFAANTPPAEVPAPPHE